MKQIGGEERFEFTVDAEGSRFRCVVLRGPIGALNGYLGLPVGHVWYGRDYDEIHRYWSVEVHGGLTFARDRLDPTKTDETWWIGFDCAHHGDWTRYHPHGKQWTREEVIDELRCLATQAAAARPVVLDGERGPRS